MFLPVFCDTRSPQRNEYFSSSRQKFRWWIGMLMFARHLREIIANLQFQIHIDCVFPQFISLRANLETSAALVPRFHLLAFSTSAAPATGPPRCANTERPAHGTPVAAGNPAPWCRRTSTEEVLDESGNGKPLISTICLTPYVFSCSGIGCVQFSD